MFKGLSTKLSTRIFEITTTKITVMFTVVLFIYIGDIAIKCGLRMFELYR